MNELKIGFGKYIEGFYRSLSPTTKAMEEFVARGLEKSIVFAPSRMVDAAEDMLASWRKNDNNGDGQSTPFLPVIIVATGKDYLPATGDYSIQKGEPEYVVLPVDPKNRVFKMRQMHGDRRAQLVIFSADEPTARSIAAQFSLYCSRYVNRRFSATYRFAGFDLGFPVMLESTDIPATNVTTEQKNLTILAIDLSLRETIPLFNYPLAGEANDGLGILGDPNDPCGYSLVVEVAVLDENTGVIRVVN